MSCGGLNTFSVGSNPFGYLNGPYNANSLGVQFSTTAYAEMVRRGFSQQFLDAIDRTSNFDRIRDVANIIRGSKPRSVVVGSNTTTTLSEQEQQLFDANQASIRELLSQIEALRREREDRGVGRDDDFRLDEINEKLRTLSIIQAQNEELRATNTSTQKFEVNGLDIVIGPGAEVVHDNPLNCYMDVQYHISLTMITQDAALDYQTGGFNSSGTEVDINTMKTIGRADASVTLASTGESLTNNREVSQTRFLRNYYNIASLTVKNLTEPTENNPLVSTMLSMKMRIAEPHGFKLHEDIRNTAINLGYVNINPGRILYRVDISFSGYDQDTGEWVERIDISNGRGIKTISSMMAISQIEAEVTSSGTLYEVDLVPAGHHAYRPEDFVMDAGSLASGVRFRDFLLSLSTALNAAKEERTQGQIIRHYEFYAPSMLLDSPFDVNVFLKTNQLIYDDTDPNHIISSGRDVDIMTMLRGSIANTLVGQELFNADNNNDAFTIPRIAFCVRFNTIYGNPNGAISPDESLNDYKEITHQYVIEPYLTFKHGPVTRGNINTYVDPSSQLLRVREIIRMGMLRRIYNYINTEENTEVIDFDIKLKAFYYNSLNTGRLDTSTTGAANSTSASTGASRVAEVGNLVRILDPNQNFITVENTIHRLFGNYAYDVSGSDDPGARRGADRLGGGFNESPDNLLYGDVTSPDDQRRNDYELYMADYLSLDLLKLNGMKVRGDPVWLLSPYASLDIDLLEPIQSGAGISELNPTNTIQVRPRGGQIIYLRMFAPAQNDLMDPTRPYGSTYPNIIGGFYQVLDVTSVFENGNFTQSIEGVKLNHLNYVEEMFERTQSPSGVPTSSGGSSSSGSSSSGGGTGSGGGSFTPTEPPAPGVTITGGPNEANLKIAFDYFVSQGFTPEQAAGLVGNFMQESGSRLNTGVVGDGGTSYGIAQWHKERWAALRSFAAGQGLDPGSIDAQVRFVVHELNGSESRAGQKLREATTAAEAALAVSKYYERPAAAYANNGGRVANANAVLNRYA
jgi:hypothetical protein